MWGCRSLENSLNRVLESALQILSTYNKLICLYIAKLYLKELWIFKTN